MKIEELKNKGSKLNKKENEMINKNSYDFLLERNKKYMNNIALSYGNKKITYEEFHENVHKIASYLRKMGIEVGDKVGVVLENTIEAAELVYALDMVGATRIGLSIFNNQYKMNRDINICKPKLIIYSKNFKEIVKNPCDAFNISKIMYDPSYDKNYSDDLDKMVLNGVSDFKGPEFDCKRTSSIIFTGGTSGIHKGVELNGRGLNGVISGTDGIFKLEPGMKHLGNIPFGHMIFGMFALHYSLSNNLEYALTPYSLPNKFVEEILRLKPDGIMGGPVHYEDFVNNPKITKDSVCFLKQATSGGETFKKERYDMVCEAFKYGGANIGVTNMLGLTEMSGLTHAAVDKLNTPCSIGNKINYVEEKIVDPKSIMVDEDGTNRLSTDVEVADGEFGLLLTKGPGMLLRYYNNIEETKKVFVYDTFGNKWYNTGDLVVRFGDKRELKFAGRLKRNFVCNYDNVYPEQIEEMVIKFPEVQEISVTKVPDDRFQFLPVYFLSLSSRNVDTAVLEDKINLLISESLGSNYLPGYIEYTYEKLPKTDNNKTDIRILEEIALKKYKSGTLSFVQKLVKE